jgi:MerR family transcriptional regulator, heat shock protein HspR
MRYLRLEEAARALGIDAEELALYERESLICVQRTLDDEPVISAEDVERARLVACLLHDLDVNLPGAEVIVHMREEMIAMRRQFGQILEALVGELRSTLRNVDPSERD